MNRSPIFARGSRRPVDFRKMTTLWVNPTTMDLLLHNSALSNVLKQFADLGHNVTLMSIRSRGVPKIKNSNVRMILVPLVYVPVVSTIMFAVLLFFSLPVFVVISKPDRVIMNPDVSILSSLPSLLISKPKKTKFVLDVRSTPVETLGFRGFLNRFWFSVSLLMARKWFDGITTLTPLMKKEICNDFAIEPDEVGVWTSGVSESLFNPEHITVKSSELKGKFGLTGKFVVFYHGIFTPSRGLTQTVEAMKILLPKRHDIVFFLLGTGPMATKLRVLIQKEGLQENIIIHNPVEQSQVPKFISMSDVGIVPLPDHPYWRFQNPLKLLEYLAMEKVVILTDIPAHRAVIGKAKCGIYISSVAPVKIAEAIEYVYLNKKNLEEWGKIGREIIKEKYTWEKVARDLENYLLLIDEKVTLGTKYKNSNCQHTY
jgi:glycosyltransferase involved in cell wall biosynthesis